MDTYDSLLNGGCFVLLKITNITKEYFASRINFSDRSCIRWAKSQECHQDGRASSKQSYGGSIIQNNLSDSIYERLQVPEEWDLQKIKIYTWEQFKVFIPKRHC